MGRLTRTRMQSHGIPPEDGYLGKQLFGAQGTRDAVVFDGSPGHGTSDGGTDAPEIPPLIGQRPPELTDHTFPHR